MSSYLHNINSKHSTASPKTREFDLKSIRGETCSDNVKNDSTIVTDVSMLKAQLAIIESELSAVKARPDNQYDCNSFTIPRQLHFRPHPYPVNKMFRILISIIAVIARYD